MCRENELLFHHNTEMISEKKHSHYNYHRWYNPDIGRYMEVDKLDIFKILGYCKMKNNDLLGFIYGYNNPVRFIDKYGLTAEFDPSFCSDLFARCLRDCNFNCALKTIYCALKSYACYECLSILISPGPCSGVCSKAMFDCLKLPDCFSDCTEKCNYKGDVCTYKVREGL